MILTYNRITHHVPIRRTFRHCDLDEWFRKGDDVPYLMRGAIYSLRHKNLDYSNVRLSYWTEKVFRRQISRWVRTRQITALTSTEWESIVSVEFWKVKAERLIGRYGCGKWSWLEELRQFVRSYPDRPFPRYPATVLVNGKTYEVTEEKLAALMELRTLGKKLRA